MTRTPAALLLVPTLLLSAFGAGAEPRYSGATWPRGWEDGLRLADELSAGRDVFGGGAAPARLHREPAAPGVETLRSPLRPERARYLGRLRGREALVYRIDAGEGVTEHLLPEEPGLVTDHSAEAVALAPRWVRTDLLHTLSHMTPEWQDALADTLLGIDDPRLIDEVAFAMAHTAPNAMTDVPNFDPEVFVENARAIYDIAPHLDYVELLDEGVPGEDPDFHTRASYRILVDGREDSWRIRRGDYYWAIVHPRISDEEILFIDPAASPGEDRAAGAYAPPEEGGAFWRRYLFFGESGSAASYAEHFVMRDTGARTEDITSEELQGWVPSATGWFGRVASMPLYIVRHGDSDEGVLIEARVGKGKLVATTMPVERAFSEGRSNLLQNLIAYGNSTQVRFDTSHRLMLVTDLEDEGATVAGLLSGHGIRDRYVDVMTTSDLALMSVDDLAPYRKIMVLEGQPREAFERLADPEVRGRLEQHLRRQPEFAQNDLYAKVHFPVLMVLGATDADWSGLVLPGGLEFHPEATDTVRVEGLPTVRRALEGVQYYWDGVRRRGLSGDRYFEPGDTAIDRLLNVATQNLWDCFEEGLGKRGMQERALQPARIGYNHFGNCGEESDLVASMSRAALIPSYGLSNGHEDHVWAEFLYYDGPHAYQVTWSDGGGDIDNFGIGGDPYATGAASGKKGSFYIRWMGDDRFVNRNEDYTELITMTFNVLDPAGRPVDGAQVYLLSDDYYTRDAPLNEKSLMPGFFGTTDADGRWTSTAGDLQPYFVVIMSPLGGFRRSGDGYGPVYIVSGEESVPGFEFELAGREHRCGRLTCTASQVCGSEGGSAACIDIVQESWAPPVATAAEAPAAGDGTLAVRLRGEVLGEYGLVANLYNGHLAPTHKAEGSLDLYLVDGDNLERFEAGEEFEAWWMREGTADLRADLEPPAEGGPWYLIVSNETHVAFHEVFDLELSARLPEPEPPAEGEGEGAAEGEGEGEGPAEGEGEPGAGGDTGPTPPPERWEGKLCATPPLHGGGELPALLRAIAGRRR